MAHPAFNSAIPRASNHICREAFDKDTGQLFETFELLNHKGENSLFEMRMDLEERRSIANPKYLCPLCARPLTLRAGSDKVALHFAHPREPEHTCPYKTGDKFTPEQLAAMKYNGLKETNQHRQLKAWLITSLQCDESVLADSIRTETRLTAKLPDAGFRVPDVRAQWRTRDLIFEAQLASTFVTTIAERRVFYREYGANLFWIFPTWPEQAERFMSKDIYYTNNFNVFVVNDRTVDLSKREGHLYLETWWARPDEIDANGQAREWNRRDARLDELTFDEKRQRVYLVDVEAELAELRRGEAVQARKNEEDRRLVQGVDIRVPPTTTFAFSFGNDWSTEPSRALHNMSEAALKLFTLMQELKFDKVARQLEWFVCESSLLRPRDVLNAFVSADLLTPTSSTVEQEQALLTVFTFLFSLKSGRAMPDSKYTDLKQLENLVFNSYKRHYRLFLSSADFWARGDDLDSDNPMSTVERHRKQFKRELRESPNSVAAMQDRSFDRAVLFVFPELVTKIEKLSVLDAKRPT
jgi:Family of unknown function (DUF6035)